mmetsp:Transcript_78272/g.130625  ORF Transcript_78272/g.130625 Transcript_78272/m.130625 type:complete len:480 (-) Transcript_78272:297-1736(-)
MGLGRRPLRVKRRPGCIGGVGHQKSNLRGLGTAVHVGREAGRSRGCGWEVDPKLHLGILWAPVPLGVGRRVVQDDVARRHVQIHDDGGALQRHVAAPDKVPRELLDLHGAALGLVAGGDDAEHGLAQLAPRDPAEQDVACRGQLPPGPGVLAAEQLDAPGGIGHVVPQDVVQHAVGPSPVPKRLDCRAEVVLQLGLPFARGLRHVTRVHQVGRPDNGHDHAARPCSVHARGREGPEDEYHRLDPTDCRGRLDAHGGDEAGLQAVLQRDDQKRGGVEEVERGGTEHPLQYGRGREGVDDVERRSGGVVQEEVALELRHEGVPVPCHLAGHQHRPDPQQIRGEGAGLGDGMRGQCRGQRVQQRQAGTPIGGGREGSKPVLHAPEHDLHHQKHAHGRGPLVQLLGANGIPPTRGAQALVLLLRLLRPMSGALRARSLPLGPRNRLLARDVGAVDWLRHIHLIGNIDVQHRGDPRHHEVVRVQ